MSLRTSKVVLNTTSTLKPQSKKKSIVRDLLKGTITGTILSFALFKTPPYWLMVNEVEEYLNLSSSTLPSHNDLQKKEENLQEEIKTFLYSKNGLNQNNIIQNNGNCQIIAGIMASTFTEAHLRKLESMIEVNDYNLDKQNFYINFTVNINGKKIPVFYKDLVTQNSRPNKNIPQAPYVLAYAVEKELEENYLPNPNGLTAKSTLTFFTNKDYSTLLLPAMSNESLIEVLKQAPNEIVCLGSYPVGQPSKSRVTPEHEYAVKSYKYENGNHLITIAASGEEITLSLDELRKNILTITAPTKSFNLIDSRAMWTYMISLILIIALRKAIGSSSNSSEEVCA